VSRTCPSDQALLAFHRGTLPAAELDALADHLETYPACEAAAQRLDAGGVDPVVFDPHRPPLVHRLAVEDASWFQHDHRRRRRRLALDLLGPR